MVLSVCMQKKYSSSNLSCSRCSHVCSLLTNEGQKRVGLWCNGHFWPICQPCSWHQRHRLSDTMAALLAVVLTEEVVCFDSVPVQRAHGPPLLGVPFNCSHGNLHYRIHHRALLKMLALPAYTRAVNNIKSLLISGSAQHTPGQPAILKVHLFPGVLRLKHQNLLHGIWSGLRKDFSLWCYERFVPLHCQNPRISLLLVSSRGTICLSSSALQQA